MTRAMKDSGIEWIGEIPGNWEIIKVKRLFHIGRGRVISQLDLQDTGYPVYSSQTKNNGCLGYIDTYDFDKAQLTWTTDGANAGTIFLREGKYNCTNVCGTLLPQNNKHNLKYLKYALEHISFYHKRYDINGFKIMNNEMAEIKLTIPPLSEQQAIADFLDGKCAEIDNLSAAITEQIDVLKQYKKSVITEAVTKGLDPNAPMKDSGVEWIGKIPEKWKVIRLKYLGTCQNGLTYKPSDMVEPNEGILVLRSSNIKNGKLAFDDNVYVDKNIAKNSKVQFGDILICSRNGSRELIGKNTLIPESLTAAYGAFMMIYRTNNFEYIHKILNSHIFTYYLGTFFTSTINQLTTKNFENMKIVYCPDQSEQQAIADYLDDKCAQIDSVIKDKETQLETLAAYKKSLIYEYVTGKKEVPQLKEV